MGGLLKGVFSHIHYALTTLLVVFKEGKRLEKTRDKKICSHAEPNVTSNYAIAEAFYSKPQMST